MLPDSPPVPFHDLRPLHAMLAAELADAFNRVMAAGWFVLGPEVESFEAEMAAAHGVAHAIGVANGTDAIELSLRSLGLGRGDEVITVSHTAFPTVCAIERAGAEPRLVDVNEGTCTIDPAAAEAAVNERTRAIVAVHLYGRPVELEPLLRLADRHHLALIEDCAQAHGTRWRGRPLGSFGTLAAFSFYPTKNLGALGDGGAVLTSDFALAERARRLRDYGQRERHLHLEAGQNSRLDELQAALLRVKLRHLEAHNNERRRLAAHYDSRLEGVIRPLAAADAEIAPHLYVVRHPRRDDLRARLAERGVQTLIHYPVPVHLQPAYRRLGLGPGTLPVTERLCREIVSLPLWLGLGEEGCERVALAVREAAALTSQEDRHVPG